MTPKPPRPYFAHAVNTYHTSLERSMVALIARYFGIQPGDVENPNQPYHQAGYDEYAKRPRPSDVGHKGMNYFYDEVLPSCNSCVAMPFLDSRMGLGVASEAKWFVEHQLPVHLIRPPVTHIASREELEAVARDPYADIFTISPLSFEERELLIREDERLVVPHIETRLRTWLVYNKTMRPYLTAHLARLPIPDDFYPEEK